MRFSPKVFARWLVPLFFLPFLTLYDPGVMMPDTEYNDCIRVVMYLYYPPINDP